MYSSPLKSVSLFSGIAGLHIGECLLYCDIDKRCRRVLKARMNDGSLSTAPIHDDVRTLAKLPEGVELLVSGFPCTNTSSAGNKAGIVENKPSGLFYEVARLASSSRVPFIFFENVKNIRFLPSWKDVLQTLHDIGYDCRWVQVSAEDVGAPHRRDRWFCFCELVRDASDAKSTKLDLKDKNMCPNGQLIDGVYSETDAVVGNPIPIDLTLVPAKGPRPCLSKKMVTKPVKRRRWATPRSYGGSFPALGLSERCSHDMATQLRFEKGTPERQRWLDHARPNASWVEKMMGFPQGWTDYMFPLETSFKYPEQSQDHSFAEDTTLPRLIISNIPNSHRLILLGNCCVPQVCNLAFKVLWDRAHYKTTENSKSTDTVFNNTEDELPCCPSAKRRKVNNQHYN